MNQTMSDKMETATSGENYEVTLVPESGMVVFKGILRLNGLSEYAPITAILATAAGLDRPVTLDLHELEFLNSSGIAMLSKFVIEARNRRITLTLRGSRNVSWQAKSLANLQRLMPVLTMELV